MAIFHAHFGTVQRSKGQNAIASAAYIGGICLQKLDGEMADYRKKSGVCGHKIIVPSAFEHIKVPSAQWVWATAESTETRKNATTARRGDLALPCELTQDECFAVGYGYAQDIADRYGVLAQVNFHDLATDNPHIDMQWTTRVFDGEKLGAKTRILDDKKTGPEEITWMREQWAKRVNVVLEKYGERIDHRSYKDQGSEKLATKHLGRKAAALERQGVKTERGKYNDKVREHNALIDEQALVAQEVETLHKTISEDRYDKRHSHGGADDKGNTPHGTTASRIAAEGSLADEPSRRTGSMAETTNGGDGKASGGTANHAQGSTNSPQLVVGGRSKTAQRNLGLNLEHIGAPRADPAEHAEIVEINRPTICLETRLAPPSHVYKALKQEVAAIERDCSKISALITQNAFAQWLYMRALQQLRIGWTYDYSHEDEMLKKIQELIGKVAGKHTIAALAEYAQRLPVQHEKGLLERLADASMISLDKRDFNVKTIVEDGEVRLIIPHNEYSMNLEVNNEEYRTEFSKYDTDNTRNGDAQDGAPSDEWDDTPFNAPS